ncbi:MAG TPA: homoserine dehydrogenase, partial [Halanaerobiales bacterium]|nr:homoserine dehydrogenase [Halanaerobiales bacterium]
MIRIGLLGLGTVGSGVYRILSKHRESIKKKVGTELVINKVLVSSKTKKREIELAGELITEQAEEILNNPDIDLIVELIGGEEPAYTYIKTALKNGKSVVTANKLVIARHEEEILNLAASNGSRINFEGSVAGGIPVIRPLQESFAANKIERIYGILNGTTNYILSGMTRDQKDFNEVLKEAQKLGYAERDPHS